MNLKVRRSLAVATVGALACSMGATQIASAQSSITEDWAGIAQIEGAYVGRISGEDRFGTAIAASKALTEGRNWEENRDVDTVFLANYTAWSDTLAATPLADVLDAPVLYTYADRLEAKTITELKRLKALGVENVILIGGEAVIGPKVFAALEAMDFDVDQIGGVDRYETSLLLAAESVDYYMDGTSALAQARDVIRQLIALEQAYQDALKAFDAAQAKTNAAYHKLVAALDALEVAQKDLATALSKLVNVPGVVWQQGTEPIVGQTTITGLNNELVKLQVKAADALTIVNWVNGLNSEYAADPNNSVGFQDDPWTDVTAWFGTRQLTVTLSTGTYTGTLAQLNTTVPGFSVAVANNGVVPTVKEVEVAVVGQRSVADAAVAAGTAQVGRVSREIVDAADASAANEAQLKVIADAQRKVDAAQKAVDDADAAYDAAFAAEAEARLDVIEATENRPTGEAIDQAKASLQAEITAQIANGRRFPGFYATGTDFADALAAGPAAASEAGVVLLTNGTTVPASTQRYLNNGSEKVAVGGPAATAIPSAAVKYVGVDRFETATKLAADYFDPFIDYVGVASGLVAADAVVGGSLMANVDGTLVLTRPTSLPPVTAKFLSYDVDAPWVSVFGGPNAISNNVVEQIKQALQD